MRGEALKKILSVKTLTDAQSRCMTTADGISRRYDVRRLDQTNVGCALCCAVIQISLPDRCRAYDCLVSVRLPARLVRLWMESAMAVRWSRAAPTSAVRHPGLAG